MLVRIIGTPDTEYLRVASIVALRHSITSDTQVVAHPRTGKPVEQKVAHEGFFVRTREGEEHEVTEDDFTRLIKVWGLLEDAAAKQALVENFLARQADKKPPPAQEPYNDEHGTK